MYDIILFDLDGTLTDSGAGVKNGFIYALEKFGIAAHPDELDKVMGPPLMDSFMQFYNFSFEDARVAVKYYREYYREKGVFENTLYDGIKELLEKLKGMGKTLCIATSKPDVFALQVLHMFDIYKYFDIISCATIDDKLCKKSDIVKIALDRAGGNCYNAIMVGDRHHDVFGAHENNIKCIGVLYGYGDSDEMKAAGADFVALTPNDILKYI